MADFVKLDASGILDAHTEYMLIARSVQHVVLAVWKDAVGPTFVVRKIDVNYREENFFYYEGKRYYLPEDSSFPCIVPPTLIL